MTGAYFDRRRLDELERSVALLAEHVGVDLAARSALDDFNRRGVPVTWAEMVAAGMDPQTGKPSGDSQ